MPKSSITQHNSPALASYRRELIVSVERGLRTLEDAAAIYERCGGLKQDLLAEASPNNAARGSVPR